MVKLVESYSGVECVFKTAEEALAFIYEKANQWNCGMYRVWCMDGYQYFDCGPRTFKTKTVLVTLP